MNLEELGKLKYADNQFENVLAFVSQIANAKINKPAQNTGTVLGIDDLRPDIARESLDVKTALMNAKKQDGTYFIVPQVVE